MAGGALYLVPGTMCDARLWTPMLKHLPGAEAHHADYTGSQTLDAMQAKVLAQAPDEPCHLVGFSLGGYLAMMVAINHPERFKSLTVIAASPYGLSEEEKSLRQRNAEMLSRLTYRGMSKTRLRQFIHERHMADEAITGTVLAMERDHGQDELMRQLLAPLNRPSVTEALLSLPIPVHFIMARNDAMVPFTAIEKFAAHADNISLREVNDSGHMIPLEAPAALAALVGKICFQLPSAP
ncbi:alpha/beta fold hydrolase [Kordiimonas sp.]|uniref:alpha/beta fold hydrolase n=1 Tax=Kordiimonas sp. TaxID=1970157 RepID=UPI003A91C6B4